MASRSTASPSRLPSKAVPWILMFSTIAGFAPATTGGTTVCTCAAILEPGVIAIANITAQNRLVDFIAVLTYGNFAPAPSSYGSSEMTVTDLGPTVNDNLPACIFAEIGWGTTVLGAAKVFTLSTAGAVRVSAFADFMVLPEISASISTGFPGSRFVISSQSLPD